GNARCLAAFTVALNQGCGEKDRVWYASTMHLQVASMGFCRACRTFATLRVRVDKGTPPSLWALLTPQAQAQPTSDGAGPVTPNRVPAVQMLSAIWRYRTESIPQKSIEVMEGLRLKLSCFSIGVGVDSVVWPTSLLHISFGRPFDQPIDNIVWPVLLRSLHL
ncbi:unnamed protein product, partial [Laminaria digitata]